MEKKQLPIEQVFTKVLINDSFAIDFTQRIKVLRVEVTEGTGGSLMSINGLGGKIPVAASAIALVAGVPQTIISGEGYCLDGLVVTADSGTEINITANIEA